MTTLPHASLGLTLATFVLVIGVLVFVHEMGHYLVARLFGIRAEAFAIGFGREIAGWTDARGTRWKIGLLPLGGYVKFAGDADAASRPADASGASPAERAGMFQFRPVWQRAAVILAGPLTNFVFALIIFAGFFLIEGRWVTPPVVGQVTANSPAERAGLRRGDRVVALDGIAIDRFDDIVAAIADLHTPTVVATVARDGGQFRITLAPVLLPARETTPPRRGLGILSGPAVRTACGPGTALIEAGREVGMLVGLIAGGLGEVVSGHRNASELGGPIKIAQISGQAAAMGLPNLIQFIAFVSINLGFINLLPVPMLDGGHLFLYAVEAVRRRPLAPRVQEWAFLSGFAALMTLMVFLTWNDLAGIGAWQRLSGLFG